MKKEVKNGILLIFITVIMLIPVSIRASAADELSLKTQFIGDNCIITGCDVAAEGVLDIPSEILGRTVTHIGAGAFKERKLLTEINLPDTVTEIGEEAFSECVKLNRLTMSDNVTVIGEKAFYHCVSLEEVKLSDSLIYIPKNAFYKCSSLQSIKLPKRTKAIGENAFFDCDKLKSIILPEGLIGLSARCFSNCSELSSICLPASIEEIDVDVFENCSSLDFIYYTGTSTAYKMIHISTGNDALNYDNIKFSHNHLEEVESEIYYEDCINGGYCVYTCVCGYITRKDYSSAKGHNFKLNQTLEKPTCTKTGIGLYECSECGYTESNTIPKTDHVSVKDKKVSATCEDKGNTEGSHCLNCNVTIKEQKTISPLGHDFSLKIKDSKHLASKATYKKAAKYYYSCSRCKDISNRKTFSGDKLTLPKVKKLDFSSDTKSVTLKWKSVSAARGYAIYKKDSKGKWSLIKRVRTNSFKIEKLTYGTTYNYAVRAYVKEGKTLVYAPEYSSIKVATKPLPTTKISAKQNEKAITLSWKKSKGATGYRVYKYDSKKEKWVIICSYTESNKLTIKKLESGRKYKFAVKSCIDTGNKLVCSKSSGSFITCTRPTKTTVKSTALKYSVKLEWSKVKNADRYVVYMSESANSGYKKVATTKKRTAEIKNLSSGKTYYFKVYSYIKLSDKNVYSYASEIKKVKTR